MSSSQCEVAGDTTEPTAARPRAVGSVTRRLVFALALIPIVPTVSIIGVFALESAFGTRPFAGSSDELRWFHLVFSVRWVASTIAVWRTAIVWTFGRRWLTALVAMIPFVQVVYARPLWTMAGCRFIADEALRVGQHEVGIGLWIWLSVWVWWGWEKVRMSQDSKTVQLPATRVSQTAKRLAMSIGTIPLLFGAFLITDVAFEDFLGLQRPSPAFAAAALIAIVTWLILWRGEVIWSKPKVRHTALSAFVCFALPVAVQWIFVKRADGLMEVVLLLLPVIGWGVWMAATISYWPMRSRAIATDDLGPRCLGCGYSLRGLRATRCPECGSEPTLDELWAATTGVP